MAKLQPENLLSVAEVLKKLNIPRHRLVYLFEAKKLKKEDFIQLGNGQTLFMETDLPKIKQALFCLQK